MPWIPNGKLVDVRNLAGLVWGRACGSISPVPFQKQEGLDVGILRRGACPVTLKIPSKYEEVMHGTPSHARPWVVEDIMQRWSLSHRSGE